MGALAKELSRVATNSGVEILLNRRVDAISGDIQWGGSFN